MKTLCSTIVILCFVAVPISFAAPKEAVKKEEVKKKPVKKEAYSAKTAKKEAPSHLTGDAAIDEKAAYTTVAQLEAMPTCQVTVVQRGPCFCMLKTEDGTVFRVGSPANTEVLGKFVGTLEAGKSYTFPDAFVEFAKKPM